MWTFLSPRDHRKKHNWHHHTTFYHHIKPNDHCHTEIPELVDSNGAEHSGALGFVRRACLASSTTCRRSWLKSEISGGELIGKMVVSLEMVSNKLSWFFAKTQHSLYTNVSFQNMSSEKWLVLYVLCFMAKTNHPSGNHRGLDIQRDSPRGTNPNVAKGVLGLSNSIIKPHQGQRIWWPLFEICHICRMDGKYLEKINKLEIVLRLKPNPHHKQLFHYMFICCIPICYNIYCSVVTGYTSTLRFPHFSIHQLLSRVSPPTTRESPHVPGPSERARMQNVA